MPGINLAAGGMTPDLPLFAAGYGVRTLWGSHLPPGGQVAAFVRSTGPQTGDDPTLAGKLVLTLDAGLKAVRSGLGDTVYVLPGHSESVIDNTMLTNLVPGTKILGVGRGSNMPVFRWTATGGQWVFNKADVVIAGLRLRMEGANGITKALAWTGADCLLTGCDIEVASGAALKAAIAIELATGATRAEIVGNVFRGSNTHNVTNGLLISNAIDAIRIFGNEMVFSATAANGCCNVNAAATNLRIANNVFYNTMTASTAALNFAAAASDGMVWQNYVGILTDGVAATSGIVIGAGVLAKFFENYVSDEAQKSGKLNPAVVAT